MINFELMAPILVCKKISKNQLIGLNNIPFVIQNFIYEFDFDLMLVPVNVKTGRDIEKMVFGFCI